MFGLVSQVCSLLAVGGRGWTMGMSVHWMLEELDLIWSSKYFQTRASLFGLMVEMKPEC